MQKTEGFGIYDAYQLAGCLRSGQENLGGVVGIRLIKELRGEPSIGLDEELTEKKMIATTRMFGSPVSELRDISKRLLTIAASCCAVNTARLP